MNSLSTNNLTLDNLARHPAICDISAIERISSPSVVFANKEILGQHKPVIITKDGVSISENPQCNIDLLCRLDGDEKIPVEYSLYNYYRPDTKINGGKYFRKILSLVEAVELIKNQDKIPYFHYISTLGIKDFLPNFAKKMQVPDCFSHLEYQNSALFVGNDSTGTQLHYDATENLLTMHQGAKRVFLIAPSDTLKLYPNNIRHSVLNFSRIDFLSPMANNFKKCHDIKILYGVVNPGETLYIPAGWWHQIQNQGLSMGVSHIWRAQWQTKLNWQQLRYGIRRFF